MNGIFGWSYPPGCNSVPGDEPMICDVCGMVDDCCCPECPICGDQGNKKCYSNNHLVKDQRDQLDRYAEILNEIYALEQRGKMCSTHSDAHYIDVELEKLYEEQDKLDVKSFGHGLVLNQAQIDSANAVMGRQDTENEIFQALDEADAKCQKFWKEESDRIESEALAKQERQYQENRRLQRQMDALDSEDDRR